MHFMLVYAVISLWSIGGECCSTGDLADEADSCCVNYYNDGKSCKECPAGYYGTNCSKVCSTSYYGIRCVSKCECSPCHHIYGCLLTTTNKTQQGIHAKSMEPIITTDMYSHMTHALRKGAGNSIEATSSINSIGQILIISIGSVISLTLILIIGRVTYTYRQLSAQTVADSV